LFIGREPGIRGWGIIYWVGPLTSNLGERSSESLRVISGPALDISPNSNSGRTDVYEARALYRRVPADLHSESIMHNAYYKLSASLCDLLRLHKALEQLYRGSTVKCRLEIVRVGLERRDGVCDTHSHLPRQAVVDSMLLGVEV
jgi:hypothetical protein